MYDARTRDRFRILVRGLTGAVVVVSATAAGAATGLAAHASKATEDAKTDAGAAPAATSAKPAAVARAPRTVVRWKDRPTRTEVHTQTVYRTVPSTGSSLGGGTVTSTSTSTGGGGGGTQYSPPAPPPPPAPAPAPQPAPAPPPPPPPPPAPSSGS